MSDQANTEALIRTATSLEHMAESMSSIREDQTAQREATQALERETTLGFGSINTSIAVAEERLDAHRIETDRRFEEQRTDIDRAHAKAGTAMTTAQQADGGVDKKTGGVLVAGGGALGTMLNKLIDMFSGGGAS